MYIHKCIILCYIIYINVYVFRHLGLLQFIAYMWSYLVFLKNILNLSLNRILMTDMRTSYCK